MEIIKYYVYLLDIKCMDLLEIRTIMLKVGETALRLAKGDESSIFLPGKFCITCSCH